MKISNEKSISFQQLNDVIKIKTSHFLKHKNFLKWKISNSKVNSKTTFSAVNQLAELQPKVTCQRVRIKQVRRIAICFDNGDYDIIAEIDFQIKTVQKRTKSCDSFEKT